MFAINENNQFLCFIKPSAINTHYTRQQPKLYWNKTSRLYNFGSLSPNPVSAFYHHVEISQYCQFHDCQVRKSVFRVSWKNCRDIGNLNTYWRFKIKFCVSLKKRNRKSVKPFPRYRWLNPTKGLKMSFFDNFFFVFQFFSYLKTPKDV